MEESICGYIFKEKLVLSDYVKAYKLRIIPTRNIDGSSLISRLHIILSR